MVVVVEEERMFHEYLWNNLWHWLEASGKKEMCYLGVGYGVFVWYAWDLCPLPGNGHFRFYLRHDCTSPSIRMGLRFFELARRDCTLNYS